MSKHTSNLFFAIRSRRPPRFTYLAKRGHLVAPQVPSTMPPDPSVIIRHLSCGSSLSCLGFFQTPFAPPQLRELPAFFVEAQRHVWRCDRPAVAMRYALAAVFSPVATSSRSDVNSRSTMQNDISQMQRQTNCLYTFTLSR